MKKVTIYDVAREAEVSLATVSRVINGSSIVKEDTRNRVNEVIKRLDFKPNEIARGLAKSKTTTIAVVFPQALFAHVKDMIGGIGDTSRTLKYNIMIHTTDNIGSDNVTEELVERLVTSRADGVILFNNDMLEQQLAAISKYKIPTVVIGRKIEDESIGSIYVDAAKILESICENYLSKGITDIAYFTAEQNLVEKEEAIKGLKDAYSKYNLDFNNIVEVSTRYEENYPEFVEYFKKHRHQVVIAGYDKEGVAVINAATENNISVPNDMEVIGFFNTSYGVMVKPTLTTIAVPVYDMGALALRLLTKMLNEEPIEAMSIAVSHSLIKRDSTK